MNLERIYKLVSLTIGLVAVSYFGWRIFGIIERCVYGYPGHDFTTYYLSARVYQQGASPYTWDSVRQVLGYNHSYLYSYAPWTLYLFKPFLLFELPTAFFIFSGLKLIAFFYLLKVWCQHWMPAGLNRSVLLFVIAFGYEACVVHDFFTGNISLFEQVFLWVGLTAFLYSRVELFVVGVLIAATCKLLPSFFLVSSLGLPQKRKGLCVAFLGALGFFLLLFLDYLRNPIIFKEFVAVPTEFTLKWLGSINPSSLAIVTELTNHLGLNVPGLNHILWFALVQSIAVCSVLLLYPSRARITPSQLVVLVAAFYAIATPKLQDYSHVIMLIPLMHAMSVLHRKWLQFLLLSIACIRVYDYQFWFVNLVIFCILLSGATERSRQRLK